MRKRKPVRKLPSGYIYVRGPGAHYTTGAAFGAGFWLVAALPLVLVARSTSGIVSDVFYGVAALFALLGVICFAFYATGHNGGSNGQWVDDDGQPLHP